MDNDCGAVEVSLSAISSKSLWQTTGRWTNSELFKFKDSKGKQYCLTATCEEDITDLMKNYITSYKDMPITVYQMTRKYVPVSYTHLDVYKRQHSIFLSELPNQKLVHCS